MARDTNTMVRGAKSPKSGGRAGGFRILVVEDDPDMRDLIRDSLTGAGFMVDSSGDGGDGVKLASEHPYDVVVSDVRLPGLNGIDLARALVMKEEPPTIILITAYPDSQTVRNGYAAGAKHVLSKPISLRKLIQLVRDCGAE
ncbi:MAG TPA: response regulator [Nitrospirales bacterium]|nr:response regulator [Nitrospirales bacterium]